MKNLLSKILGSVTTKMLWGIILILSTLLTVSHITSNNKTDQIDKLVKLADRSVEQNKRLSDQLSSVREELLKKPVEYIYITKEVDKEICNGKVVEAQINNIPSKRIDDVDKGVTADIDDRLPDSIIGLLK